MNLKRTLWIAATVALGCLLTAVFVYEPAVPVEVATVRRQAIQATVDEKAMTRLPKTIRITMPVSGRIQPIEYDEGQPVSEGEKLAVIDPFDFEIEMARATAHVNQLEAELRVNADMSLEKGALEEIANVLVSMQKMVEASDIRTRSSQARAQYAKNRLLRQKQLHADGTVTLQDLETAEEDAIDTEVNHDSDVLNLRSMEAIQAAMQMWPREINAWMDRKRLERDVLDAQKAEAETAQKLAQKNRERTTIQSPASGIVLNRVIANERFLPAGELLLEIGDLTQLQIETDLLTADASRIREGATVRITGPSIGDNAVTGEVSRIYPAGFTKLSSLGVEQQRVKVVIDFDDGVLDQLTRRGRQLGVAYRVRVSILIEEKSDALVIPRSSLFRDSDGTWHVFTVRKGQALRQAVEIGILNQDNVEVLSGLDENDQVIMAPDTSLESGTRVSPN